MTHEPPENHLHQSSKGQIYVSGSYSKSQDLILKGFNEYGFRVGMEVSLSGINEHGSKRFIKISSIYRMVIELDFFDLASAKVSFVCPGHLDRGQVLFINDGTVL
jgi:hypothetical protein